MRLETISKLAALLDMNYCHPRYCGCGGDEHDGYSHLLFTCLYSDKAPPWRPDWANGEDPEELYTWVQQQAWKNPEIRDALHTRGMNLYQRYQS